MPELPEVETVKESLRKRLLKKRIMEATIYYDNLIAYPDVASFKKEIKGQTINELDRRGKFIIFVLDDYYLLSHLRMEGKYFFKNSKDILSKHEHLVFKLDDDIELRYHDTRKFGKMYLIKKEDINKIGPLKDLGLEPFSLELTSSYLKEKLRNKNLPIKSILLDQSIITGIGNIYADEILFLSKINPLKKGKDLSTDELDKIILNTRKTLKEAITKGGTTIHSYASVDGITGRFQNELLVHTKENTPCINCQSNIERIKIGGRSTYFCPNCQK